MALAELRNLSSTAHFRSAVGVLAGNAFFTASVLLRELGPTSTTQWICGNAGVANGWSFVRTSDTSSGAQHNYAFTVFENGVAQTLTFAIPGSVGKMMLFHLVYTGATQTAYVNGIEINTAATTGGVYSSASGRFSIGYNVNAGSQPNPDMGFVAFGFRNIVYSASEIAENTLAIIKSQEISSAGLSSALTNIYSVARDSGSGIPSTLRNFGSLTPTQTIEVVGRTFMSLSSPPSFLGDSVKLTGGGGGSTLQSAYDAGSTIALSDAEGPIDIDDTALSADASAIVITKDFNGTNAAIAVIHGISNPAQTLSSVQATLSASFGHSSIQFTDTAGSTPFEIRAEPAAQVGGSDGTSLILRAQAGGSGGALGGSIDLFGGDPTSVGASGGSVRLQGGVASAAPGASGGEVNLFGGNADTGDGGLVFASSGSSDSGAGGSLILIVGDSNTGTPGNFELESGDANAGTDDGGSVSLRGGFSAGGDGGVIRIAGGISTAGTTGFVLLAAPGGGGLGRTALYFEDTTTARSGFVAPAVYVTPTLWTLPLEDGTLNQLLTTDGAGALSWSASGSRTVAAVVATTGQTLVNGAFTRVDTSGGAIASLAFPNPNVSEGASHVIQKTTTDINTFTLTSPAGNVNGTAGGTGVAFGSGGRVMLLAQCDGTDWWVGAMT